MIRKFLVLKQIEVINANAISSPYTIGFPAMTAWLGAVHALQRRLNVVGFENLRLSSAGVVSHEAKLHTYRGKGDYVASIVGTANPLDKDEERPSFIEEGRIHLTVSIVAEIDGLSKKDEKRGHIIEKVEKIVRGLMKLAGGDVIKCGEVSIVRFDDEDPGETKRFLARLMPGYTIVQRRDLMIDAMAEGKDALDALIEYVAIHHRCEDGEWKSERKSAGWIVPIAVGFQGISKVDRALNQRDPDTPHRFAESVVTLGEFKMPIRLEDVDEMLWRYNYDEQKALYLCEPIKSKQEGE